MISDDGPGVTHAGGCLVCGAAAVAPDARFCRQCGSTLRPGRAAPPTAASPPASATPAKPPEAGVEDATAKPASGPHAHPNGSIPSPGPPGYSPPGPTSGPSWTPVPVQIVQRRDSTGLTVALCVIVLVVLIAATLVIVLLVSTHDSTNRSGVVTGPRLTTLAPAPTGD